KETVIKKPTSVKHVEIADEIPKIIPAEFSLGRKSSPLAKYGKMARNLRITPKNKAYVFGGTAALVIVAVILLKSFVFVSASARALSSSVSDASNNIKTAQDKISQNDLVGAH